jgi:hypothetical protein
MHVHLRICWVVYKEETVVGKVVWPVSPSSRFRGNRAAWRPLQSLTDDAVAVAVQFIARTWMLEPAVQILLVCFGSGTTCLYISIQLFKLSPSAP